MRLYNSTMSMNDTTKEAEQILADIYRRMPVKVKARRIFESCRMGKVIGGCRA